MELLDSLDEYMPKGNPITDAEIFVAEAIETAFTPLDKPVDKEKLFKEPKRLFKGVKLSDLKKVLATDPNYFTH